MGKLAKALKSSSFVVTSELTPPKGTDLDELFAKADLLREMSGSILEQGELMGTYTRR